MHAYQKILWKRRKTFLRNYFRGYFFDIFLGKKNLLELSESHFDLVAHKIGAKKMLPENCQCKYCISGAPSH